MVNLSPFDIDTAPYAELERIHGLCFTESWDEDTFEAMLTVYGTYGVSITINDVLEGFVLYRQPFDDAEILTICVNPKKENQGFGSRLMESMLHYLKKPGKCFLEVAPQNIYAVKLYEKFNFKTMHTRKDYYAVGFDAYVMMRDI